MLTSMNSFWTHKKPLCFRWVTIWSLDIVCTTAGGSEETPSCYGILSQEHNASQNIHRRPLNSFIPSGPAFWLISRPAFVSAQILDLNLKFVFITTPRPPSLAKSLQSDPRDTISPTRFGSLLCQTSQGLASRGQDKYPAFPEISLQKKNTKYQ